MLLEQGKLSSGTSFQSAGIVWRLRPDDIKTQLLNSTRNLVMQLEAETGLDPGWVNNGGLFIASTKVFIIIPNLLLKLAFFEAITFLSIYIFILFWPKYSPQDLH